MYLHSLLHQDNRYYTKYYYDAADKMLKAADTVHWETRTTTYNYDKNGNLVQMNMPFGAVMTYDYNVENRLTAIHDKEHLLMAALYDGNGDRIFTVTNKEDTSGWHDDGNNGQWSTLKPGGDYDDGTWHPDTSSADDGKWKPDVSSNTSSNTSSTTSSGNDGQWRPEPGGNGEWNNDGQWRPDTNNNGQWKPDTTSSLTSSSSNAKVSSSTSSYNDGQWRPDSNNNGQWNPSGNDGQWKPDATSSSTSSSNNGQWNPDSGNNGQWKPDVSSSTSSATNTSSETTSSNVSSETSSDTTSSEVPKDENSGIPDVELAKGDWSNFAYDREMIRDTVLIPNGLNTWNEERYEMTGYINNINTANTQVLMEFHDKGYAGNIYEYVIGISNSYDKRESVSHWQNTNYYAYDGRGSVSDLVDGTGKVQMYHSYEPDGQTTLRFRGYIKNPYRYNAERVDYVPGIADFQYLRARYYAPNLGRFIQQDIVWGTITTPLSQNLFIYCQNNAVNMIDPSGHRAMATDGGGGESGILDDGYQFGDLSKSFGNAVSDTWSSTVGARTDAYMEDPWNFYNAANYWLIGTPDLIVGLWNTSGENTSEMLANPSLDSVGNWATLGTFDMVEGTFNPETPWSTEHWMNSFGTATLVTVGVKGNGKTSLSQNAQQGMALEQANLYATMNYLDNGNTLFWNPKTAGMVNVAGANSLRIGCEIDAKGNVLNNIEYTDKVIAQMSKGDYHAFPKSVDAFGANGKISTIVGGDKVIRTKVEIMGSYGGKSGIFEYIIEPDGITVNHRLFKEY